MVLLALIPAKADINTLLMDEVENERLTEIVCETTAPNTDNSIYLLIPEVQQTKTPFGYRGLENEIIKMSHPFKYRGKNSKLIFCSAKSNKSNNVVDYVYVVFRNEKPSNNTTQTPPEVRKLIYHDIGKDKEFCGIIIDEQVIGNDDKYKGTIRREIKLDDETAQIIIDLITNHSKYKNKTFVKIEEVKTPNLHSVEVLDDDNLDPNSEVWKELFNL